MAFIEVPYIHNGDTSDATDDALMLTELEALSVDGSNLRRGAVGAPHFDCTRSGTLSSVELATVTWINTIAPAGTHAISAVALTTVSPGGTDVELSPPNANRATMQNGDTLHWLFSCNVDAIDDSGAEDEDYYWFVLEVTGVDSNGSSTESTVTTKELGIPAGYSMNSARIPASSPGFGTVKEISDQRVSISGMYIHQGEWSANGGNFRPTSIKMKARVENAGNEITLSKCRLTAMISKG